MNSYIELPNKLTFLEIGKLSQQFGGIYLILNLILGMFIYADIGAIFFNKKKRALHDFIAVSYVITKKSYMENKNSIVI